MCRQLLLPASLATILLFTLLTIPAHAEASELEQHLRDQYQGKTFLLRGFYSGDHLRYDAAGTLMDGATSGDWTADGFVQVSSIQVSHERMTIHAKRLFLVAGAPAGFQFRAAPAPKYAKDKSLDSVKIEADLAQHNSSDDQADDTLSKIFLTAKDRLVDLVPDYWKPCIAAGVGGKDEHCAIPPEVLAVPGVLYSPQGDLDPNSMSAGMGGTPAVVLTHVGGGVSYPKVINRQDPEYSDAARQAKFQGVVILKVVVDDSGAPGRIYILKPLGCGLDAQAVRAVQTWKFDPAEKDGKPLAVEVAVEVDFHLY